MLGYLHAQPTLLCPQVTLQRAVRGRMRVAWSCILGLARAGSQLGLSSEGLDLWPSLHGFRWLQLRIASLLAHLPAALAPGPPFHSEKTSFPRPPPPGSWFSSICIVTGTVLEGHQHEDSSILHHLYVNSGSFSQLFIFRANPTECFQCLVMTHSPPFASSCGVSP